ncbi:MAG: type I-B CRISPR-associated protein Cas8b1/Cst1, partial [Thermodesulforhabdaceae bacterium]
SASEKGAPNSFWNLNPEHSLRVCDFCSFVLLSHHLALTRLSDGSEMFINAPSFQVMWYLNKFAREVFGSASSEEMRSKRNILAMSVIEYAMKIQATLGVWTGMNIEVVNKHGSKIEFFSLPYEVIQLLADRRIASLLSQIGEFSVLNLVLAQDFSRLLELGYRLLRIGLKPHEEWGKSERDFVNQTLRLDKNRENPARVADQIFQLYALLEEKRKRREPYEQYRIF